MIAHKKIIMMFVFLVVSPVIAQEQLHGLPTAQEQRYEDFDGFDEFDEAVEDAINIGFLKEKPEMRQPSAPEVVARRIVSYLFMKYLLLKDTLNTSYQACKLLGARLWSMVITSAGISKI